MRIEEVAAFGFAERVIDNWRMQGQEKLLPLQEKVIAETGLLAGRSVVVFASTSAGKTFVAELAAVRQWEQGRKSVFLVPTKALAEELYARLRRVYSPLGVRVAVATRERTAHDARIARGHYDFAVMVYEKLKAFLTVSPGILKRIGMVAVDELQILGDPGRGDVVDLLLARIVSAEFPIQIVGLSAVLAENARLADWLRAGMFVWRERPIELREGVFRLSDGAFVYREFNSRREGAEYFGPGPDGTDDGAAPASTCPDPAPEDFHFPAVEHLVEQFVAGGEQVLVFVPTRHLSRQWAWQLGRSLAGEGAGPALAELERSEESHSRTLLEQCFRCAVAFHNSDLPHDLRGLVEREFQRGNLRVLVATSTLAQGVNLRVRNVISIPAMLGSSRTGGAPDFVELSRQQFRNQGGRAGRLTGGTAEAYGRSILIGADDAEAERLMQRYVFSDVEPLEPPVSSSTLERVTLDLMQSGSGGTGGELEQVLAETYSAWIGWGAREGEIRAEVESALTRLEKEKLVTCRENGSVRTTAVGRVAATYGLRSATVQEFARWCGEELDGGGEVQEFELFALCAGTADGAAFPLGASAAELRSSRYPTILAQRCEIDVDSMRETVRKRLQPEGGFPPDGHALLKKAFAAEAWLSDRPTVEVEEEFQLFAGTLANLGSHLSWLFQALAATAEALGVDRDLTGRIRTLALRLPDGMPAGAEGLAALGIPGLSRGYVQALMRQGFDSAEALAGVDAHMLESWLPGPVAERLADAVGELERSDRESRAEAVAMKAESVQTGRPAETNRQRTANPRRLTPAEELNLVE